AYGLRITSLILAAHHDSGVRDHVGPGFRALPGSAPRSLVWWADARPTSIERYADAIAGAPDHAARAGIIAAVGDQVEPLRDGNAGVELEAGAAGRDVADRAGEHRAVIA